MRRVRRSAGAAPPALWETSIPVNDTSLDPARAAALGTREATRRLSRLRDAAIARRTPPPAARSLIGESWKRVLRLGVDPDRGGHSGLLSLEEMEQRRRASPISEVLPLLRDGLVSVAHATQQIMVITDAEGRVLWRDGSPLGRRRADALGFTPGASWSEDVVGTNAVGTALVTGRPLQVHSAEHFVRTHHPWSCAAAPLHDPRNGRLLGVVDVSGPAASVHPATLALVTSVARLAESELRERHLETVERLRSVAAPILCRLAGERALAVDRDGWPAAVTGMPPPDRLVLPERFGAGRHRIPSLGPCTVEPLPDGWLVRMDDSAPDGDEARPALVELDVRQGRRVLLTVSGQAGGWTQELSPRHAELLYALARRRDGRTAAQLAQDLFGDPSRTVTVRAEMSRLRRTLGGVLDHRPYRFADDLEVRLLVPEDPAHLLPRSTAPLVAGARSEADERPAAGGRSPADRRSPAGGGGAPPDGRSPAGGPPDRAAAVAVTAGPP
ncbi:diguanylate cyclase [Streptomyces sp. Ru87]|uniref:GAF domain-containing protein n=1 Tax=Streptomyces lycii TaxID=2654337 RepID=A0ABQ7FJI1_9ACTN|nr:GAF domain-containing protein [Streptomyces lycii]PGH47987.1 diguanylate cyclase [Streptomyces sp. Ru87]